MSDQEWPKVFIYMQDGLRSMGDVVSPHLQQFGDIVSGFADQVDEWGTRFFNGEISLPTIVIEKPRAPPPVPAPFYSRAASWAREHRWLVLAVGTVTGAVAVRLVTLKMRQHTARRRRAPRAANGARREAVLMVGATADAIGKSLTLDLERRGYVLFCVVSNSHEHDVLEQEGRNHLHVLNLDAQNPYASEQAIERMDQVMTTSSPPLTLAGLVVVPDICYATGPIETIPLDDWRDIFYVNVFGTVNLLQAFLPMVRGHQSKLLLVTSSNLPALNPPFNSVQSVSTSALGTLWQCMHRELCQLSPRIDAVHVRTGLVDLPRGQLLSANARANMLSWTPEMRSIYSKIYASAVPGTATTGVSAAVPRLRGTPVRILHNTVFDILQAPAGTVSRVVYVGLGARLYAMLGRFAPERAVSWMLGCRLGCAASASVEQDEGDSDEFAWGRRREMDDEVDDKGVGSVGSEFAKMSAGASSGRWHADDGWDRLRESEMYGSQVHGFSV